MDLKALIEKMKKEDRLLSEDAVMKAVQQSLVKMGYEPLGDEVLSIFEALENIPVAYDVEKVVAELKNESDYEPIDYDWGDTSCSGEEYFIATGTAIDIVKRGGIE